MTRGEIWLAQVGRKTRPVLVLTRPEVIDVRRLVTVAEITTSVRGLAAEVDVDHDYAGLAQRSVINCDGLHTVTQATLATFVGTVDDETMSRVCWAVSYALGCLEYQRSPSTGLPIARVGRVVTHDDVRSLEDDD